MSEQTAQDSELATYDVNQVVENAKDLNMLAALAIPDVMEFLFPPMYIYFWKRCTELASGTRGFPKFALGIPRGHGKTIFIKLLIVFIILFTRRKFVLIIAANDGLAAAILADVMAILDHQNIRMLFGNWDAQVIYDRNEAKSFHYRGRDIILKAKGQGSTLRGIAEKFARPDVIILDDAQTEESSQSETQALQFINWMRGTLMKAKNPKFCFYLYVGNMYRRLVIKEEDRYRGTKALYGCQLRNLKESKHWESLIVGGILQDGTALWEELQPLAQLLSEYNEDKEEGTEAIFLAEVMNDDEAYNSGIFDPNKVPAYPYPDETWPDGAFLLIDPSLGKKKSDGQEVGLFHVLDGIPCLVGLWTEQVSAPQLVRRVIDFCLEKNVPAIAVEAYAYQESLGQWFEHYLIEEGIEGISVVLTTRGTQAKTQSIRSMFKEVMAGDILLHPRVRSLVYTEARNWDPLKTNNKDGKLDVCSYGPYVMRQFPDEIRCSFIEVSNSARNAAEVVDKGMNWG